MVFCLLSLPPETMVPLLPSIVPIFVPCKLRDAMPRRKVPHVITFIATRVQAKRIAKYMGIMLRAATMVVTVTILVAYSPLRRIP